MKGRGRGNRHDASIRRRFVLQVVQPGLVGLMDGSVSTLAPLFAAAFATHSSRAAFAVRRWIADPALQIVLGGLLVFLTGMLIGGA